MSATKHPPVTMYTTAYCGYCRRAERLLLVPLPVIPRHGMNVVRDRIAVGHVQRLRGADADHTRHEHAAVLIQADACGGRLEVFSFQAGLNVDESVGQASILTHKDGFIINRMAGVGLLASGFGFH